MTADRPKVPSLTQRQMITVVVFILVGILIIWQVVGLFGGGSTPTPKKGSTAMAAAGGAQPPPMPQPQAAQLPQQPPVMSQREMELLKLQQETEAKYIEALNQLQMLKVTRDIAETSQAIASAKLATITAEKSVVDLLTKPVPQVAQGAYAQSLGGAPPAPLPQAQTQPEINYTVISVSQLQYKWSAVVGSQGNLYNVNVGDHLPVDGSLVLAIDRSGVTLERNGVKRKVSLVPII